MSNCKHGCTVEIIASVADNAIDAACNAHEIVDGGGLPIDVLDAFYIDPIGAADLGMPRYFTRAYEDSPYVENSMRYECHVFPHEEILDYIQAGFRIYPVDARTVYAGVAECARILPALGLVTHQMEQEVTLQFAAALIRKRYREIHTATESNNCPQGRLLQNSWQSWQPDARIIRALCILQRCVGARVARECESWVAGPRGRWACNSTALGEALDSVALACRTYHRAYDNDIQRAWREGYDLGMPFRDGVIDHKEYLIANVLGMAEDGKYKGRCLPLTAWRRLAEELAMSRQLQLQHWLHMLRKHSSSVLPSGRSSHLLTTGRKG